MRNRPLGWMRDRDSESPAGPGASLVGRFAPRPRSGRPERQSKGAGRESFLAVPRFPAPCVGRALFALNRPHALRPGNRGTAPPPPRLRRTAEARRESGRRFPSRCSTVCYEGPLVTHPGPAGAIPNRGLLFTCRQSDIAFRCCSENSRACAGHFRLVWRRLADTADCAENHQFPETVPRRHAGHPAFLCHTGTRSCGGRFTTNRQKKRDGDAHRLPEHRTRQGAERQAESDPRPRLHIEVIGVMVIFEGVLVGEAAVDIC